MFEWSKWKVHARKTTIFIFSLYPVLPVRLNLWWTKCIFFKHLCCLCLCNFVGGCSNNSDCKISSFLNLMIVMSMFVKKDLLFVLNLGRFAYWWSPSWCVTFNSIIINSFQTFFTSSSWLGSMFKNYFSNVFYGGIIINGVWFLKFAF